MSRWVVGGLGLLDCVCRAGGSGDWVVFGLCCPGVGSVVCLFVGVVVGVVAIVGLKGM